MGISDAGREPVTLVEIDQAVCSRAYGAGPCTAALSSAYPNKCFNTRETCQDTANFALKPTPLTLRFCKTGAVVPRSWGAIPCLESVTTTPIVLNPGGASKNSGPLGARATVTIKMRDLPSADFRVDPYQSERFSGAAQFDTIGYNPLDRGTYWSKWIRRNPYYINFPVRIREGYIEESPAAMTTRHYIIEDVTDPGPDGKMTIKAQDILGMADDNKATCPVQSKGILSGNLTAVAVTVPLVNWVAGEYPATGTIRIGDECITYTGQNTVGPVLNLTGCTRGTDGTLGATHSDADRAQLCYRVADADNIFCWEVAQDLLENYAGIDPGFIPIGDWDAEGNAYLSIMTATALITEPTGVNQLLGELCQQFLFNIWWDERDQEIKLRAIRAMTGAVTALNERQHIMADSWSPKSDLSLRVSEVWLYYKQKDPTKKIDDTKNYSQVHILVDPGLEAAVKYQTPAIKSIYSRWMESSVQAIQVTARYLARFQNGAKYLKIQLDAKDRTLWTGDLAVTTLHSMVDDVGLPEQRGWQVISAEEITPGEIVEYTLMNYNYITGKYGYYMDAVLPHAGYYSDADGFALGDEGYCYQ